jgi:uncharacterized repeat protein (TIGR02543 family)
MSSDSKRPTAGKPGVRSSVIEFDANWPGGSAGSGSVPLSVEDNVYPGYIEEIPGNTGNLTKSNYTWLGWAWDSSASSPDFEGGEQWVSVDGDTLYAVWQQNQSPTTYSMVYNGNGNTSGSAPTDGNSPYSSGATVTVLGNSGNLAKTNYAFLGWSTNSSATSAQYTQGSTFSINANTTLYAVWIALRTVTYNGNGSTGGSAPTDNSSPYHDGATVTVLGNTGNLVKTNNTFLGWSTNSSASSAQYTQGQTFTINSNTTLYAVWQVSPPNTYTVTYNGNGSTSGSAPSDSNSYVQGASVTVAANSGGLAKTGHNFIGWATVSNASSPSFAVTGSNVNPPNFNMPASHVTLYAVWQIITATVVYDGNGQTSGTAPSDSNSPYNNGATITVLGNTGNLVKTNYTFLGWSTNSSASSAQYTQGQTFTITQNTTLYAVWQSTGGGGGFDGGVINNSLAIKCKFPFFGTMEQIYAWMKAQPGSLPDYSAFLRFSDINTTNLSTDIYGIVYKDDTNTDTAAVGVNDSLFVRKDLYARGFIRSAKSILPIEKWKNNTPTNNDNDKILDVDLGSEGWPFGEIITVKGRIGELIVPQGLYTDWIEGYTPNIPLTIGASSGGSIKLDGNVLITGTLTGNGGGNITFGGGNVFNPIILNQAFPVFTGDNDVQVWMYPEQNGNVSVVPSGNLGLVFTNSVSPSKTFKTFGARVLNPADPTYTAGLDAFAMWSHLFVRGDFKVRGMVNTYEGKFVAHAGPKLIGWGREGHVSEHPQGTVFIRNPEFIIWDDEIEGNTVPTTWDFLIARPIGDFKYRYDWAHIAANSVICHGIVHTNAIGIYDNVGAIESYNTLMPHTNAVTKDLGQSNREWENLYVKNLHVSGSSGNVKRGTASTNNQGTTYVPFGPSFPSGVTPRVTATVKGAYDPIIITVDNITNAGFTVRTYIVTTAQHRHTIPSSPQPPTQTNNWTPSAGDGFVSTGAAFDWIAVS